jgi:hypothetical protein
MNYHPINIQALSKPQIRKLLKCENVRVKHGNCHEIHVDTKQYKKIMKASDKGMFYTINFNPHQAEMHGGGMMGNLYNKIKNGSKKVIHTLTPHLKKYIPQIQNFAREQILSGVNKGGNYLASQMGDKIGIDNANKIMDRIKQHTMNTVDDGLNHGASRLQGAGIFDNIGRKLKNTGRKLKNTFTPKNIARIGLAGLSVLQPELTPLTGTAMAMIGSGVKRGRPKKQGGALYTA